MSKITLQNMEFHAYHGCMEHEKTLGNTFYVNLSMELNTLQAESTDELTHTLNYQEVYDVVKHEMNIPSKLIEHVSRRIADALFSQFNQIDKLNLKLTKMNPPLGAKVESVCIEIEKTRLKE